jgi:hypothetical protein
VKTKSPRGTLAGSVCQIVERLCRCDRQRLAEDIERRVHLDQDGAIPLSEGEKHFARANEPKQLVVVLGASHSSVFSPETWTREMRFFERYKAQQSSIRSFTERSPGFQAFLDTVEVQGCQSLASLGERFLPVWPSAFSVLKSFKQITLSSRFE